MANYNELKYEIRYGSWDGIAAAMVEAGVDQDYVAEMLVAWDRDCPDIVVSTINYWQWTDGKHMCWVMKEPTEAKKSFDWCPEHRRWERVGSTGWCAGKALHYLKG